MGAVDSEDHKNLDTKFGIKKYPTVMIFNGKTSTMYSGERTVKSIVERAKAEIKKRQRRSATTEENATIHAMNIKINNDEYCDAITTEDK